MHLYNVPVIQPDLRHEETIIQTANAFEYLEHVIGEVFDKIDARIYRNNKQINDINHRITVANDKIESLVGTSKAINIFSPAKYPARSRSIDVPATFSHNTRTKIQLNTDYRVHSKFDPISHRNINDKLQCYHVRDLIVDKTTNGTTLVGLGPLPYHIGSINNILLFNESKNVYCDDNSNKNGMNQLYRSKQTFESSTSSNAERKMSAPPMSILNRKLGNKKINENLFYTPGLSEAPQIDVPHDLPDLPGIADDIEFNITDIDELPIVPSQLNALNLNITSDLPPVPTPSSKVELVADTISNTSNIPDSIKRVEIESNNQDNTFKIATALEIQSVQVPPLPTIPTNLTPQPPPPPPPPPPAILLPTIETVKPSPNESNAIIKATPRPQPIIDNSGNMHNSLMAAIRQAGGKAKLRAAELRIEKKVNYSFYDGTNYPFNDFFLICRIQLNNQQLAI